MVQLGELMMILDLHRQGRRSGSTRMGPILAVVIRHVGQHPPHLRGSFDSVKIYCAPEGRARDGRDCNRGSCVRRLCAGLLGCFVSVRCALLIAVTLIPLALLCREGIDSF